ncbi:MAG: exo-alpha-sialidase [Planctomycetes bacterium]|nr:exo-alpha-sialidase [Planctomycetota bacterium]
MSDRIYVGTRKGLFTIERRGGAKPTWEISQPSFLGDNIPMLLPDRRDGTIYAAISLGHFGQKLHRSTDGGKTWEEIAVPVYPPLPEGASPDLCPMRKVPIPWSLELIWSLEAGGANEPGTLWCGTNPGGLFRSRDRGASWEIIRPLWDMPERKLWFGGGMDTPGIHSVCVNPKNPAHVSVGISCGGVWATRDAGATWACKASGMRNAYTPPGQAEDPNTQDVHRITQSPSNPDLLWAQHHNGIFRSTDGSNSWQEIPTAGPSTFGFAVAVHPKDGNTAWFVPAMIDQRRVPVDGKVVVTRTRDGGKTFDVLSNGLPQQNAYDIAFRHALDVDPTGTRLAMGSTTGSLWVSENQGDSWTNVSEHLPPVYCVRFG